LVAGIAALVKIAFPSYTPEQVREQLRATADNIDEVNGASYAGLLGRGRVNALRAVTETDAISVRMTDYTIGGTDDNGYFDEGEEIKVTATFTNYLSDIGSWTYEWVANSSHIDIVSGATGGGNGWQGGDSQVIEFTVRWRASMSYKSIIFIEPKVRADGRIVSGSDAVRFVANDVQIATHTTPSFLMDVTSDGDIGHVEFSFTYSRDYPGNLGQGFNHANPVFNLTRDAGIAIGTGPDRVSASVFEVPHRRPIPSGHIQNTDFVPLTPLKFSSVSGGLQQSRVWLTDTNSINPLYLNVLQESRVNLIEGEDIALFRYMLHNTAESSLENVHMGFYVDWNIYNWSRNTVGFDEQERITYTRHDGSYPTIMGTMALSEGIKEHSRSHTSVYRARSLRESTDAWPSISQGIEVPPNEPNNWAQMVASGPFSIEAGAAAVVGFAIIYGSDLEDLRKNARRAREMYVTWGRPQVPSTPTVASFHEALKVSWNSPPFRGAPITGYNLRYCKDTTACDVEDEWMEVVDLFLDTTGTVMGLVNDTTYQVQVRSVNSIGKSDWSLSATGTPESLSPNAPNNLVVIASHETLEASWSAPPFRGVPVTGYSLRHCKDSTGCDAEGNWIELVDLFADTIATISGLANDTTYQVQVRSVSSIDKSDWSLSVTGTPRAQPPDTPTNLVVEGGTDILDLSWTASDEHGTPVTGYFVQHSTGNGAWLAIGVSISGTTARIRGLANGVIYHVRVKAQSLAGDSPYTMGTGVPVARVAVGDDGEIPEALYLHPNYPNPFNPTTEVVLDLPYPAEVQVMLFDALGRPVLTVPRRQLSAGFGQSISIDAGSLASGTYLYRIMVAAMDETTIHAGRMVLVK